ncbi:hypothetical protein KVV02_008643 [Mortierella alpina]|uniref:Iron-binding zinc finger CDGSH type domain-containing protein n=1 Tax=Mortierella alpina TaxID=64518 RepID=A0A9P8CZL1_MORAP|nr:hypothetical protein KVV02_008643 [Mortierella alpina]
MDALPLQRFLHLCSFCYAQYNPCSVRGLKPGSIKEWCTCGLTKKGPWCDGKSHKGTTFKPLRWKVPDGKNTQTFYSICDCRYTTRPPFCDGIHYDLPLRYLKKIKECPKQPHDPTVTKLCEECGWAGPRESWPELPATDSDEDTDHSDEEDSEEEKAKKLAANTPKLQVQLPGQENEANEDQQQTSQLEKDAIDFEPRFGCNGSCQAVGSQGQAEMSKIADEISRVHLS